MFFRRRKMKTLSKLIVLLIACGCIVTAQSIILSTSGVSSGGGFSSGPTIGMQSSAGVPATDTATGGSFGMSGGIIPVQNVFTGTTFSIASPVSGSWNMVSVPSLLADNRKTTLLPSASSKAFGYNGAYRAVDTLKRGLGYWVKYGGDTAVQFLGTSFVRETIDVADKWNMIGGVSYPIASIRITPLAPVTIASSYFGYSGTSGYSAADTLKPGRGYWIKVHNAGKLIVDANVSAMEPSLVSEAHSVNQRLQSGSWQNTHYGTLTITDASGKSRNLYFSATPTETDPATFELPPPAPDNLPDVRYATNSALAVADQNRTTETTLRVSHVQYPITLRWINNDVNGTAALIINGKEIGMKGAGATSISEPETRIRLRLTSRGGNQIPAVFALQQNYPNPFNPSTMIRYQIPSTGKVNLKIYNVLGQQVETLVDEVQEAGYKSVKWNAEAVASGVYYYQLTAGTFSDVKKMMVIK
jgi:hypothetical protein